MSDLTTLDMCRASLAYLVPEMDRMRERETTIRMGVRKLIEEKDDDYQREHYYDMYSPSLLTLDVLNALNGCGEDIFTSRKGAVVPKELMEQWWTEEVLSYSGRKEGFIRLLSRELEKAGTRAGTYGVRLHDGPVPLEDCILQPEEGAEFCKFMILKNGRPYACAMITNKGYYPVSIMLLVPRETGKE